MKRLLGVLLLALVVPLGAVSVKVGKIPPSAQLVFHHTNMIFVSNADGTGRTQITFDNTKTYEHVAVSPDRRYIAANYFTNMQTLGASSKMVLYDLVAGTETALVPTFVMAGNGGVDWDLQGRIYFAAVGALPFPNPTTPEQSKVNAGANDIWRIKFDGTGLTRITNTQDKGEADVSVHEKGGLITYVAKDLNTNLHELWVKDISSPTGGQQKVFTAFDVQRTVHDPEMSPDGAELVFSMLNPDFHNFPNDPQINTAQDIYRVKLNGTGLLRITAPGPISILPDWKGTKVIHMRMSDQTTPPWSGMIIMNPDGGAPMQINDVNMPKFIP